MTIRQYRIRKRPEAALFFPAIGRTIKAVRPYRPRNRLFEPKELSIRVMTALREAENGGATLEAIAERIMADKGLDAAAGRMIRGVVAIALKALRKRGVITLGNDTPPRWMVTL